MSIKTPHLLVSLSLEHDGIPEISSATPQLTSVKSTKSYKITQPQWKFLRCSGSLSEVATAELEK